MGKILRRILIPLVIVLAVVAIGDRVANYLVERRIATEVADTADSYGAYSDQRPDVTVHGWPFLTQAWSGEFEQIDITLSDVGAEGLTFPSLELVAYDVAADWRELRDGGDVVAQDLDVAGTVSTASVAQLLSERTGYDVAVADDGTATITASVEFTNPITGQATPVDVEATGQLELGDGTLSMTPDAIRSLTEGLPDGADQYIEQAASGLGTTVELPELPYNIQLTELGFSGGNVEISGSASEVTLT
ncbi:LmeA family phospholipid-binding protein [Glycomyces buryatensis]|uniref:LmeA family phospholipid-binding protein n=1 Tax=Glycomyces buryatensis TaxID=2570927 RepID=UPI0014562A76|nr:DUF2993 domain-containing protein [Glycomyces buryatensis]